ATNLIDINVPKVPDFFEFKNLELYCAPAGGTIGTVSFQPGFSFSADLVVAGKEISFYTRVNDTSISGAGHIDKLSIGPLHISGEKGKDASLSLELSTSTQSLMIDGAFKFLGLEEGLYVNVSSDVITFKFEQNFFGALKFDIDGHSSGALTDPDNLDFKLSGEMDSNVTSYLKNQVASKIDTALKTVESTIDVVEKDVENAQQAYETAFKPAQQLLNDAQTKADELLKQLTGEFNRVKSVYAGKLTNAQVTLTKAEADYNGALDNAQNAVNNAEKTYNSVIDEAQAKVDSVQKTYDSGMDSAQNSVNTAEKAFNSSIGSAQSAVNSASRKCDSLLDTVNNLKRQIANLKWYEKALIVSLGVELAGVYTAYGVAKTALATVNAALELLKHDVDYTTLEAAKVASQVAKTGADYTAFAATKASLQALKTGADYGVFEAAKGTLAIIKYGTEYPVWQAADKTLSTVKSVGEAAVAKADSELDAIAKSAVYVAVQTAKTALSVIEQGTEEAAFGTAKAALAAAKTGSEAILKLAEYSAKHAGDLIDIKSFTFTGDFKVVDTSGLFEAKLKVALLGQDHDWTFDFNVKDVVSFIDSLFEKALTEIKTIA
ncbi:MAG: hypothetical protein MJK04_22245, partial [Psychrosphaera sp.]|nr:hypothetical protein [Psychrosphaera sp.]